MPRTTIRFNIAPGPDVEDLVSSGAMDKIDGVYHSQFGPALDKLYDLLDEDREEECIREARELLNNNHLPTYHRFRTYIILGSIEEYCQAELYYDKAEILYEQLKIWHPVGRNPNMDKALDLLGKPLQNLRDGLDEDEDGINVRAAPALELIAQEEAEIAIFAAMWGEEVDEGEDEEDGTGEDKKDDRVVSQQIQDEKTLPTNKQSNLSKGHTLREDHRTPSAPEPAVKWLNLYTCEVCQQHFVNTAEFRAHKNDCKLICTTCDTAYTNRSAFEGHKKQEMVHMLPCATCSTTFLNKVAHERHQTECTTTVSRQHAVQMEEMKNNYEKMKEDYERKMRENHEKMDDYEKKIAAQRKELEDTRAQLRSERGSTLKQMSIYVLKSQRELLASDLGDLEKKDAQMAVEKKVMADKLADLDKSHTKVAADTEKVRLSLSKIDDDLTNVSD